MLNIQRSQKLKELGWTLLLQVGGWMVTSSLFFLGKHRGHFRCEIRQRGRAWCCAVLLLEYGGPFTKVHYRIRWPKTNLCVHPATRDSTHADPRRGDCRRPRREQGGGAGRGALVCEDECLPTFSFFAHARGGWKEPSLLSCHIRACKPDG